MATVTRFQALPLVYFFFPLFISNLGGPDFFRIRICTVEYESLPVAELRGESKTERDAELLYLREEIVSIVACHEQPICRRHRTSM
ncbi:MAG: hypothetical protein A4E20_08525 [Nitrospira sp. SG-bin2]|nr:MAG: hypothetical protein A4E20_08525 [Nitrospira sp. SG-bin2]